MNDPLAHLPHGPVAAARRMEIIFGASGEGKTTYMTHVHDQAARRGVNATFIDTNGECAYVARYGQPGTVRGLVTTVEGWFAHVRQAARLQRPYNIVVQPEGSLDELWALIARAGNCLVSFDEMDQHAPPGEAQKLVNKPLGKMLSKGRNRRISVLGTCRLPPELNSMFKGLATSVISFRQENEDHAQTIARSYFQRKHPRAVELLTRGLGKFEYLRYTGASGRLEKGRAPAPGPSTPP
jgi:hypothetical protein